MPSIEELPERIRKKIVVDPVTRCWNWTGRLDKGGYSRISYESKTLLGHRVVMRFFGHELIPGLQCDHLCRNRVCVNPNHIEQVTQRENCIRGFSPQAENARKTCCPKCGGPYSVVVLCGRTKRECHPCRKKLENANHSRRYWRRKNGEA